MGNNCIGAREERESLFERTRLIYGKLSRPVMQGDYGLMGIYDDICDE